VRLQVPDGPGKAVDRHGLPGLLTAAAQVQETTGSPHPGIGLQELLVPAGIQWKEIQAVMLGELPVWGKAGEGHPMAGGGQPPGEFHARVDDAGQTRRYDEEAGHSGPIVADSAGSLSRTGSRDARPAPRTARRTPVSPEA